MTEPWIVHCGHRRTHMRHWHDGQLCPGMAIPIIPGPDPLLSDDELDTLVNQLLGRKATP